MFGVGPVELFVVGMVGLLLFGGRLPDVAKNIGKTIADFRKALNEED